MEDILEEPEMILEKDMFFSIWTKPTETFAYIFKNCPTKYVNAIISWYGVANALAINLLVLLYHTHFSFILIIIVSLSGWLFGWISVYISSLLMSWSGGWIGGRAGMDQFITVSAWSLVPSICATFPLAVQAIVFENHATPMEAGNQNTMSIFLYYLMVALRIGLDTWSLVIFVKGTAVLQKFNYRRAVLNMILASLVILIPIIIVGGLIYLLQ